MSTSDVEYDPSVFEDTDRHDIDLTVADLLGTHTYEGALYTGSSEIVNVLTGENPDRLDQSVEKAKAFAARNGDNYVAKARHPEAQAELGGPYSACAFYHTDITGGMDWHTIFRRAVESDAYNVEYEADYQSGDLTITVTPT
jgi:hypothetical protein